MINLYKAAALLFMSTILVGCASLKAIDEALFPTPINMTELHYSCGLGTAEIESYSACMTSVYQANGGIDEGASRVLTAANEAAELVKLGRMTKGQGYSHIVKVRSQVNAENAAAFHRNAAAYSSSNGNFAQPMLDSMNKLLESNQNSGLTSDYWQEHRNGRTLQCRRWGTQVTCQ